MNAPAPVTRRRPALLPKTWYRLKGVFAEALERDAREREAYVAGVCGDDAELRARVLELLHAHAVDDGFIERSAAENLGWAEETAGPSWIDRRIGRYRVVAEAGRGGLSYVFRAVRDDGEYEQQVAIKLLRPGVGTSALLARFQAERRMLATLSHPNIAHFLDGGATDDDVPYLVMEYVEGEPIDEWCDARGLGLEQRLELFRTLCAAVHYVHQNLVVHGDLKGGNVLVTRDGVVKLLDFGIAKLLDADADTAVPRPATLLLMTPEYASPEQLRGETITTASDVYSLGAMLYRLVTGATPFGGGIASPVAIAERIAAGEPVLPSAAAAKSPGLHAGFARALRGDLDTIVLKALKRAPDERYGSAQQLADDVQRHLRGLPVEARPESARYRLAKFAGRHKAATLASGLFVLALVGGIAASLWQAHEARVERERAERHFQAVRQLSATFLGDVYDAIAEIPGSTEARKLLVDRTLEYLAGLERDAAGSMELRRDLAKGYERLGDVQGAYLNPNLGDVPRALDSYRRALAIREAIVADSPTLDDRVELLRMQSGLAEALLGLDRSAEAATVLAAALPVADAVLRDPGVQELGLRVAASVYLAHGWLEWSSQRVESGLASLERARGIHAGRLAADPKNRTARRDLALTVGRLGDAHMRGTGRREEALRYYREAYALFDGLVREVPENGELQRGRTYSRATLGQLYLQMGRPREALRELEPELPTLDGWRLADPEDAVAPLALAAVLNFVGEARLRLGEASVALARYEEAGRHLDPKLAESSTDMRLLYAQWLGGLAQARAAAAKGLAGPARAAALATARDEASRAVAVLEPLSRSSAERIEAARVLAATRPVLGSRP